MRWYFNLKVGRKLATGFGICLTLALVIGWTAVSSMQTMDAQTTLIVKGALTRTEALTQLAGDTKQVRLYEFNHLLATDKNQLAGIESKMQDRIAEVNSDFDAYDKSANLAEDRANLAQMKSDWALYMAGHEKQLELGRAHNDKDGISLIMNRKPVFGAVVDQIDKMASWNRKRGGQLAEQASETFASARRTAFSVLFVAILVSVMSGIFIARSITGPIATLSDKMNTLESKCVTGLTAAIEAMADGDLTVRVTPETTSIENPSKDEVGMICTVFNRLLAKVQAMVASYELSRSNLSNIVREVQGSAASVTQTSGELSVAANQTGQAANEIAATIQEVAQAAGQSATTSQEMASGSEQQARTATEAAGAMERLSSSIEEVKAGGARQREAAFQADEGMKQAGKAVLQVTKSAQEMAESAKLASSVAMTGGKAVDQTIATMAQIKEQMAYSAEKVKELDKKGQEIGAIVETIDQIAEQTNLLALNAAIEAARAGEHGKGFAVVADEVRKLAERATGATKEIGTLIGSVRKDVDVVVKAIEESNTRVAEGAVKSQEAGAALEEILEAANQVAIRVQEVSGIADEMNASVAEVQSTVATVRQVAEEQAKAVIEMANGSAQVSASITTVASISQETAAGAEQMSASAEEVSASAQNVSAAVEEQTASVEQVSSSASELETMAVTLKELVQKFKIENAEAETKGKTGLRVLAGSGKKAA